MCPKNDRRFYHKLYLYKLSFDRPTFLHRISAIHIGEQVCIFKEIIKYFHKIK